MNPANLSEYRYVYTCASSLIQGVLASNTGVQYNTSAMPVNSYGAPYGALDKLRPSCPLGSVMTKVNLALVDPDPANRFSSPIYYQYTCASLGTSVGVGCSDASTLLINAEGYSVVELRDHNVACSADSALQAFALENTNNNGLGAYRYQYTCCKL